VAFQQFVAWLLGRVNSCRAGNQKTCNHHSTRHQLADITFYQSKGLDQLPWKGLDRGSGSEVWIVWGAGAWSRPYILSRSHMWRGNVLMVPHGWETLCQIRTSSQGLRVSNIQQSVKGNMQQPKAVAAWWILTATLSNRFHAKQQLFHRSVARIWESHLKPVQSKYIPVHSISQVAFKT